MIYEGTMPAARLTRVRARCRDGAQKAVGCFLPARLRCQMSRDAIAPYRRQRKALIEMMCRCTACCAQAVRRRACSATLEHKFCLFQTGLSGIGLSYRCCAVQDLSISISPHAPGHQQATDPQQLATFRKCHGMFYYTGVTRKVVIKLAIRERVTAGRCHQPERHATSPWVGPQECTRRTGKAAHAEAWQQGGAL